MRSKTNVSSKVFILLIIIVMAVTAGFFTSRSEANSIVSMSSDKVTPGSDFYLVLSLGDVSFTKFKVEVTNSQRMPAGNLTDSVSSYSTSNVVTSFIVDKNLMSIGKLGVAFTAPNTEGMVSFDVKITSLDSSQDSIRETISALNAEIGAYTEEKNNLESGLVGADTTSDVYTQAVGKIAELDGLIQDRQNQVASEETKLANFTPETASYSSSIEVKQSQEKTSILDNLLNKDDSTSAFDKEKSLDKDSFDKEKMEKEFDKEKMQNEIDKKMLTDSMKDMESKMSGLETSLKNANDTITSLSQGTTYNGSQNNYLSTLSISGVEFESAFKKTTSDYFATVDSTVTSVNVTATAEDSSAVVTVYGDANLTAGRNKVLINVTAEDGSIRTYRIFIDVV